MFTRTKTRLCGWWPGWKGKLEANAALVEKWLDLLEGVARKSGLVRTQIWLIANEGFSPEANDLAALTQCFGSSRQQFEILTDRLSTGEPRQSDTANEFQLIFPMGADNEMLAASAVEQVAPQTPLYSGGN